MRRRNSFDYPGRLQAEGIGNRQTDCLGGLEIDDEVEFSGPLYWQVRRARAPKNFVNVSSDPVEEFHAVCVVCHYCPEPCDFLKRRNKRHLVLQCDLSDSCTVNV